MENKYLKKRKWIVLGAILLVLTLTISGTYALWNYFKVSENQQLVAGEIYMKYSETNNTINIQNAMPTNTYDPSQVFEFTIEGKNTYTKPIWYEIVINWGEETVDRHTRIPDKFLRFRLTEQLPGGEETEVIKEGKYSDFSKGKTIWVNTIKARQTDEIKITYKLYMWVSNEMHLGAGDDASSSDMDMNTWTNDAFASVKVSVNGDFEEKELDKTGVEQLKEKLGTGGLVGIPTTCSEESCDSITDKNADKSTIREYRYSGTGVNNYVTFNDEKWRIIGIFKDEAGQEHMKIVRDEVLKRDVFPATYTANGETFNIQYTSSGDYAYWDYPKSGTRYNNWGEAGLMYWLNSLGTTDGYLKSLSSTAQNMIYEDAKWYLGTVTYLYSSGMSFGIKETPIEAYKIERAVTGCTENKGPSGNSSQSAVEGNSTCRVWANNAATWTGKIGLMYPSDYGFSADSQYWNTQLINGSFKGNALNSSWLQKEANHSIVEWLLSPSSEGSDYVAYWFSVGGVGSYNVVTDMAARPVLYLKSDIEVTGGEGTSTTPFTLSS